MPTSIFLVAKLKIHNSSMLSRPLSVTLGRARKIIRHGVARLLPSVHLNHIRSKIWKSELFSLKQRLNQTPQQ